MENLVNKVDVDPKVVRISPRGPFERLQSLLVQVPSFLHTRRSYPGDDWSRSGVRFIREGDGRCREATGKSLQDRILGDPFSHK